MAILEILHFPDPRLREVTDPITVFDDELSRFIDDMFETMYDAPGVGLAATQVGDTRRVAVMDCSEDKSQRLVMCNPRILWSEDEEVVDEGCLSVPEHYDRVTRATRLRFAAQDRDGTRVRDGRRRSAGAVRAARARPSGRRSVYRQALAGSSASVSGAS